MIYQTNGFGAGTGVPGTVVSAVGSGAAASASLWGPALIGGTAGGPIGAAIGAGIAIVGGLLNVFGIGVPNTMKIQASNDANQVEAQMAQNYQVFINGPHTYANQQIAIQNFNILWNQLVQLCSNPNLGTAGQNCIADRQRGGKWDWFAMHLDPIVNTPITDAGSVGTIASEVTGGVFGANTMLILGGAILLLGIMDA